MNRVLHNKNLGFARSERALLMNVDGISTFSSELVTEVGPLVGLVGAALLRTAARLKEARMLVAAVTNVFVVLAYSELHSKKCLH
jgi:hypothetical protein